MQQQTIIQSSYIPVYFGKLVTNFSKERGQWLLAHVDQQVGWPQKRVLVIYRGRKVLLLPPTKKYYAAAAILTIGRKIDELDNGKIFLMQFLSALAWYRPGKIDIAHWTNSSTQGGLSVHLRVSLTRQMGMTALFFRPTELPDPDNKDAQKALAFFREGLSLNHLGYSFLSYYKIINMRYPNGKSQIEWIDKNLSALDNVYYLKDRLDRLKSQHAKLAEYIFVSCRCAVAHAGVDPVYDPESIDDATRFHEIKPIVHALAKIIIENEFGIKTTHRIHREHLYELAGFHQLVGEDVSKKLKAGEALSRDEIKIDTKISLRLWNMRNYKAFERLTPRVIQVKDGVVFLELTRDGCVMLPIALDFPNEKLIFEPLSGAQLLDDNTANAASQFADAYRFYGEMIANGVLEAWDYNSGLILGRLLEYLPVNISPAQTRDNFVALEKQWRAESKRRKINSDA